MRYACIFLLLFQLGKSEAATTALSCHVTDKQRPMVLKQAPSGARRLDQRTLEIGWQHGRKRFRDVPPFDQALAGTRWHYCTYDRASGFHLIKKTDADLGSGVLLKQSTGQLLDAGRYVIFSPGQGRYFASRQPNGLDGEQWILFHADGHRLWQGLSGISGKDPGTFVAELSRPHWNARNTLQATLTCISETTKPTPRRHTVTLEFTGGRYRWLPIIPCT